VLAALSGNSAVELGREQSHADSSKNNRNGDRQINLESRAVTLLS
jgi:hypothetical protein